MEWNAELEAVLRENPEDESAWAILEDWTLEQGDLRARVLEMVKSGREEQSRELEWQLQREVFGNVIGRSRCGYLVSCSIREAPRSRIPLLERVVKLPLLQRVHVSIDQVSELETITQLFAGTSVRELELEAFWSHPQDIATFEPKWLAPTKLERLHLLGRAVGVPWHEVLARMKSLTLTPGAPADLLDLFEHELASLTELTLDLATLQHRQRIGAGVFENIFNRKATPALARLVTRNPGADLYEALTKACPPGIALSYR